MADRRREQLENEVIKRCRKMARIWKIPAKEAVEKARLFMSQNSDDDLIEFLHSGENCSINQLNPAHKAADKTLGKIAREVEKTYSRASQEMSEKVKKHLDKFKEADARMAQNVKDGSMTEEEYDRWRTGQFMQGETWEHLRDELAEDASNSNDIAKSVVKGHMPDVYAENYNYGTYEIEHGAEIDTTFTLYDHQTVERLLRENPKLLPDPAEGSETAKKIAKNKDLRWNRNHIQGELLQGILQGESIPEIAKRMRNVETMNRKASMRYARTMTTGAENAGRMDSYKRAEDMGIDMAPAWMATLDGRTRDSHRSLDGEVRDSKTGKFSNGCRFPGDPEGRPEEVYNCRCTVIAQLKGFENNFSDMSWRKSDKLGGMSYADWKKEKSKKPTFESSVGKALEKSGISWRKPQKMTEKKDDDRNIAELGGADKTKGSCSSLAFAWAGRQAGLDILDFRDGDSRQFFASNPNIEKITQMVGGKIENDYNDFKATHELMKSMDDWDEYYLATGRHAAVIRKVTIDGKPEYSYLELQSRSNNGWHELNDDVLRWRFRAQKSHTFMGQKYKTKSELIKIEDLKNNEEFLNILGFINTDPKEQHKGAGGHEK